MTHTTTGTDGVAVLAAARDLAARGAYREAIDALTDANRRDQHAEFEQLLVELRRDGGQSQAVTAPAGTVPIASGGDGGTIVEIDAAELSVMKLREGLEACGCLLVRGLIDPDRAERLAGGIDAALDGYDASLDDRPVDPAWYDPRPMPDRSGSGLPEDIHREFLRGRGSLWTADSPRMLFELFEFVDDRGLGALMTEFLGERPLLSGLKATMRRMPPDVDVEGRWHQDGAFLGEQVGAVNIWLALSSCGRDAPALDVVPKRVSGVIVDESSRYDWSLSDEAVAGAAGGAAVRPEFAAGDALLFDQLLVHRTGVAPGMTRDRYALESWFFSPSAYPVDQIAVMY